MTNWKTNLGGAISITGTSLIGIGLIPQVADMSHSKVLTVIAIVGFCLSAVGKGITALFAADASVVNKMATQIASNTIAIETKVNK